MITISKTKIVCTIGPGTESQEQLNKLVLNGMNVARINLSHGNLEQYEGMMKKIRKASKFTALLMDTKGPEIRTGMVKEGTVLKQGQKFTLTTRKIVGDQNEVFITYKNLVNETFPGDRILIDNGTIDLTVIKATKTDIICKVTTGAPLGDQKGVNHPSKPSKQPSLTKHDMESLRLGMKYGLDFVALSFVRGPKDVLNVRKFLKKHNHSHVQIIAKIEAAEGVKRFDEILEVTDGVMVARGDLGIEIATEDVPLVQKMIIRKCNQVGKPVITATQMLESMVNSPRPTRAEASDVANAILDGTDAVMLSEETAIGKYPMHSVRMMKRIAKKAESAMKRDGDFPIHNHDDAMGKAVLELTQATGIKKILVATKTGFSARNISKFRPAASILTATPDEHTLRQLALIWGVRPVHVSAKIKSTRELIVQSIKHCHKQSHVTHKDEIIIVAASPLSKRKHTNLIEIQKVADLVNNK